jgi:hypothetical protein
MSEYAVIVIAVVIALIVAFAVAVRRSIGRGLPVVPRRLMTPRERDVLLLIEAAVPQCRVHAQVGMGGLVDCRKGLTPKESTSLRNRFDRKRIDFVLEERSSGDVLALVELDDRTHNEAKDRARDEITNAAEYRTIRLRAGKRLDAKSVRDEISAALAPQLVAEAA